MRALEYMMQRLWNPVVTGLMLISLCACSNDMTETGRHDGTGPQTTAVRDNVEPISSASDGNAMRNPYFGDLHVHTSYSLDSYIYFNPVDPRQAYRFAQGETVTISGDRQVRLREALDFAAVTDHAEFLGELSLCLDAAGSRYEEQICRAVRNETKQHDSMGKVFEKLLSSNVSPDPKREPTICGDNSTRCLDRAHNVWQELQKIAQEFYHPGKFTTFVAYEWTANTNGSNLHRNVIFRNEHVPKLPASYFEAKTPEQLWTQLRDSCRGQCEVLVIPHNSNQSNGMQFTPNNEDGSPLTVDQALLRNQMEPLVEIIQAKGESECHTGFGTKDELCNFEKLERRPVCPGAEGNLIAPDCAELCDMNGKPDGCIWARNYIRNALKDGLLLDDKLGVNPFKFGFIGSTDTHNGTPGATAEDSYNGHHGIDDGTPTARASPIKVKHFTPHRLKGSGGLAGVWAEENTRDSIFAALKRRETFGTSGTRMLVRFFGGWDYPQTLTKHDALVEIGHQHGVPMGADLPPAKTSQAPRFLVWAMKAADGMNLQRVQIIKGWLEDGETKEQVYDVVCSDGLQADATTQRCPDNGARVDITDCSVSSGIGAVELTGIWEDPQFNAGQHAFYYTRVLENPSCRWTTFEANRLGQDPPAHVDPVIQERAWSSPIWYSPH